MKTFKEFQQQLDEIGNHFSNLSEVPKKKVKVVNPDVCESVKKEPLDPPPILIMKRKSIRQFPNNQRVALYFVDKINQYVTVPYTSSRWSARPIEESLDLDE